MALMEASQRLKALESEAMTAAQTGNLPKAEKFCRMALSDAPHTVWALALLGKIATTLGQLQAARGYYRDAASHAPEDQILIQTLNWVETELASQPPVAPQRDAQYLLIKCWGQGFWSDVSHVLGQLLLAEITGRTPIVHWGANSLFGDATDPQGADANIFHYYFEPIGDLSLADLTRFDGDFFPPKWSAENLKAVEVNTWKGAWSRMAALYCLNRPERVVVSDFYTGIADLSSWIPENHPLSGQSVEQIYRLLIKKYLRPNAEILAEIETFYEQRLAALPYISVHVRGADKYNEQSDLGDVNDQYFQVLDDYLAQDPSCNIFLFTDDNRIFRRFTARYGDKVIYTDCDRTDTDAGVHVAPKISPRRLAEEVMVDSYLAARGLGFVGNGASNVSCMVVHLKDWREGETALLAPSRHEHDPFLHNW
ncbi:MAG: hypothetical protein ACJAU6_002068 [Alphaproteobacteria bacterium]|jgi:protein O-GlcNAc transferase